MNQNEERGCRSCPTARCLQPRARIAPERGVNFTAPIEPEPAVNITAPIERRPAGGGGASRKTLRR